MWKVRDNVHHWIYNYIRNNNANSRGKREHKVSTGNAMHMQPTTPFVSSGDGGGGGGERVYENMQGNKAAIKWKQERATAENWKLQEDSATANAMRPADALKQAGEPDLTFHICQPSLFQGERVFDLSLLCLFELKKQQICLSIDRIFAVYDKSKENAISSGCTLKFN